MQAVVKGILELTPEILSYQTPQILNMSPQNFSLCTPLMERGK